jgi:hypothetical protein
VHVEGSRRLSALAVALSWLKRHFLTGLTPWILIRTYTQNIRASKHLGGGRVAAGHLAASTDTMLHRTFWLGQGHGLPPKPREVRETLITSISYRDLLQAGSGKRRRLSDAVLN